MRRLALALCLVACSTPAVDSTGTIDQAIAGGSNDLDTPEANTVVELAPSRCDSPYLLAACTGTLITPTIVLTAAHCFNGSVANGTTTGMGFPVCVAIGSAANGPHGRYSVSTAGQFVAAETGPVSSIGNDIALLFLDPGQAVVDSPYNPQAVGTQPYVVHPSFQPFGSSGDTLGQAGWSPLDSLAYRQVAYDLAWNTGHDDDDPGGGWNSWEHVQGSIHTSSGDSGGPLFLTRTDARGHAYRDVLGPLSTITQTVTDDYDQYADITNRAPAGNAWLLSRVVDNTRTANWRAHHPGYAWFGDVEYQGPCDAANDADCDHWTNAHDNCPNNYNPDQRDSADTGVGDACYLAINSVSPNQGGIGTSVTITGVGFLPNAPEFQWLTNIHCWSSVMCTGTIASAPLYTAAVHLSAAVHPNTPGQATIYSQPTNNDLFTIYGSGGSGCSGSWSCAGSNDQTTDAGFQCPAEAVDSHYQLRRQTALGPIDVPTSVTYTPGPTNLHEYGYIPLATETTLTYFVCLVRNSDGARSCGNPIVLTGTTNHCPCIPTTCDYMGACQTTINNGCGGSYTCGACSDGSACVNHQCQGPPGGGDGCTPIMAAHHLCS